MFPRQAAKSDTLIDLQRKAGTLPSDLTGNLLGSEVTAASTDAPGQSRSLVDVTA